MQNIFIIHGSNSTPNKHWYPWLKKKLEKRGFKVFVPEFTIGKDQDLNSWLNTLESYKKYLSGSIMIGHSLGAPFILNVLAKWNYKLKAAYLVSGFVGKLNVNEPNIDDFANKDFDWIKIKTNCDKFYVINSNNDPYIPLRKANELAKYLNTNVIVIKNGSHFQKKSGYNKFKLLLKYIEN